MDGLRIFCLFSKCMCKQKGQCHPLGNVCNSICCVFFFSTSLFLFNKTNIFVCYGSYGYRPQKLNSFRVYRVCYWAMMCMWRVCVCLWSARGWLWREWPPRMANMWMWMHITQHTYSKCLPEVAELRYPTPRHDMCLHWQRFFFVQSK